MTTFLLVLFGLTLPRLTLLFICCLTNWMGQVYADVFWPIVGWFLAPYTTLSYVAVILSHGSIRGVWIILLVFAILLDVWHFQRVSMETSLFIEEK